MKLSDLVKEELIKQAEQKSHKIEVIYNDDGSIKELNCTGNWPPVKAPDRLKPDIDVRFDGRYGSKCHLRVWDRYLTNSEMEKIQPGFIKAGIENGTIKDRRNNGNK